MAKFSASDFERTSGITRAYGLQTLITGDTALSAYQKKIQRIEQSPEDRFSEFVAATAYHLTERGIGITITDEDLEIMLSKSQLSLIKPGYLNPLAYILGYYVAGSGSIDKKKMNRVFSALDSIAEGKVVQADVVRYARLWSK